MTKINCEHFKNNYCTNNATICNKLFGLGCVCVDNNVDIINYQCPDCGMPYHCGKNVTKACPHCGVLQFVNISNSAVIDPLLNHQGTLLPDTELLDISLVANPTDPNTILSNGLNNQGLTHLHDGDTHLRMNGSTGQLYWNEN